MQGKSNFFNRLGLVSILCLFLGATALADCPIGCAIGKSQAGDCPYHPQHLKYDRPVRNNRPAARPKGSCPISCGVEMTQAGDCPYHPQHLKYPEPTTTLNSRGERVRYVDVPTPYGQGYYGPQGRYVRGQGYNNQGGRYNGHQGRNYNNQGAYYHPSHPQVQCTNRCRHSRR